MQIAAIFLFLTFVVIYEVSAEGPASDGNVGGGVTNSSSNDAKEVDEYEVAKREKEEAKKALKDAQNVYDGKKKKCHDLKQQKRYEAEQKSMSKGKRQNKGGKKGSDGGTTGNSKEA